MRKIIYSIITLISICTLNIFAQSGDDIVGLWYGSPDSKKRIPVVEIYKEGNKYYAYSFIYKNSSENINDVNNPDKNLRDKPLRGLVYLYDLEFSKGEWVGGKIYNPDQGKTYNARAKLSGEKLIIRASIDTAGLAGKTLEWTKVPASEISKYKPLSKSELRKLK